MIQDLDVRDFSKGPATRRRTWSAASIRLAGS